MYSLNHSRIEEFFSAKDYDYSFLPIPMWTHHNLFDRSRFPNLKKNAKQYGSSRIIKFSFTTQFFPLPADTWKSFVWPPRLQKTPEEPGLWRKTTVAMDNRGEGQPNHIADGITDQCSLKATTCFNQLFNDYSPIFSEHLINQNSSISSQVLIWETFVIKGWPSYIFPLSLNVFLTHHFFHSSYIGEINKTFIYRMEHAIFPLCNHSLNILNLRMFRCMYFAFNQQQFVHYDQHTTFKTIPNVIQKKAPRYK